MDMVCEKMVLAVLSGSDSAEVVHALNDHGFYATMLASTGGFLQKKSVTLMIGLPAARLDEALALLSSTQANAWKRLFCPPWPVCPPCR